MKKKFLIVALLVSFFTACKKEHSPAPDQPVPAPITDARTVLLKEVTATNLPSPYFRYVYNNEKFVTEISFASSMSVYQFEYENSRVKKMTNIKNGHKVLYTYSNKHVAQMDEYNQANEKIFSYEFQYDTAGKLTQVGWKEYTGFPAGHLFKKALLTYYPDGNLSKMEIYYATTNVMELTITRQFSGYDDKMNVDDFYMLEEFFDTFLFLPQVKIQLNNPAKEIITGKLSTFKIDYQYQFNNDLPVIKSGVMVQTQGPDAGKSIQIGYQFSYY
jgi:hypothetical protein